MQPEIEPADRQAVGFAPPLTSAMRRPASSAASIAWPQASSAEAASNIASVPSPMNFSTSPPCARTAETTASA